MVPKAPRPKMTSATQKAHVQRLNAPTIMRIVMQTLIAATRTIVAVVKS
jgi:hypothetical protein